MRLGRSGCRRGGLPPPLEKGRVGEGIKRRRRLIPTRLAPLADLPFSRGGKPSLLHRIDSTKIHHALAHVPEKWIPVFRKGHAQTQESRAHPDSTRTGCALL